MSESLGDNTPGMKLHNKILLGLLVGALLGVMGNLTLGGDHPLVAGANHYVANPVGQIFLRMLFMIVIPLVFASITLGVAGLGDVRRLGRVGGKTMGYFLVSTALAVTLGLALTNAVRPGERLDPVVRAELLATYATEASTRVEVASQTDFGVQTLINIVTRNPVRSAADLDMLGIIFFGLVFGMALTQLPAERAKPMVDVLRALEDVVIKIVELAMRLAPYGVAGLIFGVTSRFGFELLGPLGAYVLIVFLALAVHVGVTLAAIMRFAVGVSPVDFFNRLRSALVTAFSTSSSSATLPTALATAERNLGIPSHIAGFVLPLGATMNMNGTALFEGITVVFLCQVFGVDLSIGQTVVVMLMTVITAIGAAGVPGGSIPLLVGILAMFGVPGEGIAIILGIDRILDMARTTVNVCGDLTASAWVARSERVWDPSMMPAVYGLDHIAVDEVLPHA
jgi:DAACS family dicarboxylate/amino acid:cation (Na+ or H+) symporter